MKKAFVMLRGLLFLLILIFVVGCTNSNNDGENSDDESINSLELIYFGKVNDNSPKKLKNSIKHNTEKEQIISVLSNDDYNLEIQVKNQKRYSFTDIVIYSEVLDTMVVFNEGNGEYTCATTTILKNDMWVTNIIITANVELIKLSDFCSDEKDLIIKEINFLDSNGKNKKPSLENVLISKVTFNYSKDANIHYQGEWDVVEDASCIKEGTEKIVCVCGYEKIRYITKPHDIDCEGLCSNCKTVLESEGIEYIYEEYLDQYIADAKNVDSDSLFVPINHNGKKVFQIININSSVQLLATPTSIFGVNETNIKEVIYLNGSEINELISNVKMFIPSTMMTVPSQYFDLIGSESFTIYEDCKYLGTVDNPYHMLVDVIDKTKTNYTIHEKTVSIYRNSFKGCSELTSINIPNNIKFIGSYAFYNCEKLSNITLSNSLETIDNYAFANTAITNVVLPETLRGIPNDAFDTEIDYNVKDNVLYLGTVNNPYFACMGVVNKDVKSVKLDSNTVTVASRAFSNNQNIESIDFGDSLLFIGVEVCNGNRNMNNIIIPSSCEVIRKGAFKDCPITGVLRLESLKLLETDSFKSVNTFKIIVSKDIVLNGYYHKNIYCLGTKNEVSKQTLNDNYIYIYSDMYDTKSWHYDIDGFTPILWE